MKQVNPLQWGPSKILFRSTDSLDELLLVIAFIIKHSLEVLMFEQACKLQATLVRNYD